MTMESSPKRFTGRHMLIITLSAFGIIIAVNGAIAYFAMQSWSGLIEPHPYKESQVFDERLAKQAEDAARGWDGDLRYNSGRLTFTLNDAAATLGLVAAIEVALGRPTHEREDKRATLTSRDGLYTTEIALGTGLWNAKVEARGSDGRRYEKHFRFYVKEAR